MIYVFFAHGFEEIEAVTTVDILRRAGLIVKTVGVDSKTITGAHGITIHCDLLDKIAGYKDIEAIVLPGGMPGTSNLENSKIVSDFIDYCAKIDTWIAAICAAPSILGDKNLLTAKRFTCFPGYEKEIDGIYTAQRVEVDGKFITASGAGAAVDFALKIVECLCNSQKAEELRSSLQ